MSRKNANKSGSRKIVLTIYGNILEVIFLTLKLLGKSSVYLLTLI
ncbi:hypothetical protein MuYL_0129 [Mucilaginibacter xinganensis]|uniref:Uncharacterized protein n=1 Tax=Mucilaginibacter xinganensis TaxID=1234841 RepID=A0A223NQ45_9SPHI|nr:hypothetical protein MuYL_0129 [Mucilaginibacter xinganensis]